METLGIVIALYNEDSSWIHKLIEIPNVKIYIYLKKNERLLDIQKEFPTCVIEVLKNQGRESHTYLYHIIKYYSNLDTRTIFLQGNPFDHVSFDIIMKFINKNTTDFTPLFGIFNKFIMHEPFKCDKYGRPNHFLGNHIEFLYFVIFNKQCPEELFFYPGAQFIVSKENINQHSILLYDTLLKYIYIETIPFVLERLWGYIFKSPQSSSVEHDEE